MRHSVRCVKAVLHVFQRKLGKTLMRLAFNLESWQACGGDHLVTPRQAQAEAVSLIERALDIFYTVNSHSNHTSARQVFQ